MNALATIFGAGWTLFIVVLMVLWFFFPFVIFSINNKLNDTNEHLSNVISELKKLNDKWSWDNKESLILFTRVVVEYSSNDRRTLDEWSRGVACGMEGKGMERNGYDRSLNGINLTKDSRLHEIHFTFNMVNNLNCLRYKLWWNI